MCQEGDFAAVSVLRRTQRRRWWKRCGRWRKERSRMISEIRVENDMFDTMWAFLQMGNQKANYPALKSACMELRQMMMQKTAGQRKDKKKDISFDNLARVKNEIIIEAMALVLSGEYEEGEGNGRNSAD